MGACWDLLQEFNDQYEMPAYVYGIDGENGVVKPFALLLNRMAGADFGWHDKAQGDGFGHVIHAWAAVGRPLIGHASHYAGKMGSAFWTPETSLDLDRMTIPEVVERVRTITPSEHRAMCERIRAIFDEVYRPDEEAAAIAEFLGLGVPSLV